MSRIGQFLRWGVSLILVAWLAARLDWPALGRQFSGLDWRWIAPAALAAPLVIVLLAVRWRLFLQAQRVVVSFADVLRLIWGGQFFNSYLPGSTGGDVYKIVAIGALAPNTRSEAAATVILDRLVALLALFMIALGALAVEPGPWRQALAFSATLPKGLLAGGVLILAVLLAGTAWLMRRDPCNGWAARARQALVRIRNALLVGVQDRRTLGFAVVLSFSIHLANFFGVFCLARSLGTGISYGEILLMMPVVMFAVLLPVTVNGHGLREMLLIGYFQWLGLSNVHGAAPREAAIAFSVLYVASDLCWGLPGGVWFALHRHRRPQQT